MVVRAARVTATASPRCRRPKCQGSQGADVGRASHLPTPRILSTSPTSTQSRCHRTDCQQAPPMDAAAGHRRLAVLARQLEAASVPASPAVVSASSTAASYSAYASATSKPSSYARVHGEVSRAPAQWRLVRTVAKEELVDVKYEKAAGESIAKVPALAARCRHHHCAVVADAARGARRSRSTGRRSAMPSGPGRCTRCRCASRTRATTPPSASSSSQVRAGAGSPLSALRRAGSGTLVASSQAPTRRRRLRLPQARARWPSAAAETRRCVARVATWGRTASPASACWTCRWAWAAGGLPGLPGCWLPQCRRSGQPWCCPAAPEAAQGGRDTRQSTKACPS
jgi:hypothetical protein